MVKSEPLNAAEILAKGREPRTFLVTQEPKPDTELRPLGVIPVNSYTLMIAESGHGKTWISLDLARIMATPRDQRQPPLNWLGIHDIEPRKVLHLDEENGEPLLGDRLGRLGLTERANLIVWSRSQLKIDRTGDLNAIIALCQKEECQVVFLDSLVRFHQKNENEAQDMAEVTECVRTLVAHNLTVIALHHTRKGKGRDEDMLRGSTEITAGADTVLFLKNWESDRNMFTLSASKLRYASREAFRTYNFRREEHDDRFRFVYVNETKKKEALLPPSTVKDGKSEASKRFDPFVEEVLERVRQLISDGHKPNVSMIRKGRNNKEVGIALNTLTQPGGPLSVTHKGPSKVYSFTNEALQEAGSA